jgi:hypothetical protein
MTCLSLNAPWVAFAFVPLWTLRVTHPYHRPTTPIFIVAPARVGATHQFGYNGGAAIDRSITNRFQRVGGCLN